MCMGNEVSGKANSFGHMQVNGNWKKTRVGLLLVGVSPRLEPVENFLWCLVLIRVTCWKIPGGARRRESIP